MILGFSRGGGVGLWVPKCPASIWWRGAGSCWGVVRWGGPLSACVVTPMLVSDPSPVALDFMAPKTFVSGAVCVQGGSSAAWVPVVKSGT